MLSFPRPPTSSLTFVITRKSIQEYLTRLIKLYNVTRLGRAMKVGRIRHQRKKKIVRARRAKRKIRESLENILEVFPSPRILAKNLPRRKVVANVFIFHGTGFGL
jgi:hypothetical protein